MSRQALVLLLLTAGAAPAQSPPPPPAPADPDALGRLERRQEALEQEIAALRASQTPLTPAPLLGSRYDNGFLLVPVTDEKPFSLKVNLTTQPRYTGFSRSQTTWTDSSGAVLPVRNRSDVEFTRNFLTASGTAFDPNFGYAIHVLTSSAANSFDMLGWVHYRFSDAFDAYVGYWKLPGTREWTESFRHTLASERSLATTYFRPSLTPGAWVNGVVGDLHYTAMVGNSFNAVGFNANRLGTNMATSGNAWWEPLGPFGPGFSDVENHDHAAVRLGGSLTHARDDRESDTTAVPENTVVRLSDGTQLFRTGSLAPGVNVVVANNTLLTLDAGLKVRGLSLFAEYFLRRLGEFRADGPLPVAVLYDHGALLQGGYFVVPTKVELFARTSGVAGGLGSGGEYGGGVNWYVFGTRNLRATLDVMRVEHSPAQNILTGYRAGASGTLVELQLLADF